MANKSIDEIKKDISEACRVLASEGLVDAFGHASVRVEGTDTYLTSPHMSPALVQPEDVITMNLAGEKLEGEKSPNSESWIHTCIYRKRPDVSAIIHIHPFMVRVLTIVGQTILPTDRINFRFHGVPTFTNAASIWNEELGIELADVLGSHKIVLQRGHGASLAGDDLKSICFDAVNMENAAKMQVWATMIGKLQVLTEEELSMLDKFNLDSDKDRRKSLVQRGWDYYLAKLEGKIR